VDPYLRPLYDALYQIMGAESFAKNMEKGLIEEAGRMDVPGRPILYRTTELFLRTFAISSLSELPALPTLGESEQVQLELDTSAQDAGGGQLSIGDTPDSTAEETG